MTEFQFLLRILDLLEYLKLFGAGLSCCAQKQTQYGLPVGVWATDNCSGYVFPYELYIQLRIVSFVPSLYVTRRNLVFWIPCRVASRKLFGFTWFLYILFLFILTQRNMIYLCRSSTCLWSNWLGGINDKWVYGLIQEVTSPFLSPCKESQLVSLPPQDQKFLEWRRFHEKFMRKNSIPVKAVCNVTTLWDFENTLGSVHQHKIGRAAVFYLRSAE